MLAFCYILFWFTALVGVPPWEQGSKSTYYNCRHAHVAPMCKWPLHMYRTRWFHGFNELDLEWISSVVAKLRCLQDSKSTYYALGHTHVAPMGKWPWRCTSTVQEGSHELHLEWIGPAAIELRCPQSLCRLAGRTNKEHSIFPLFFLQKGWGWWAT